MSTMTRSTPKYRHDPARDLGIGQVAKALGVHPMTARRYVLTGVLYGWKRAGTRWMIPAVAVDDFLAGHYDHALDPDDPEQTTSPPTSDPLVAAIEAMVALAPPLTAVQRDRLAGLLHIPDAR